ncbi:hypothetical protein [Spirosoma panaciterrae]|uniref:hypothetical protein n=1 Tax=Spirosoma panaciterrae TaxID=496058 RepID=UPI00037F9562|nr:hypothetical protein [Spirosoma panaciterrae]
MDDKSKALSAFKAQVEELESISNRQEGRVWADFTVGIIKKYIGKDSRFLTHIESSYSIFYDKWSFDSDKRLAKELIRKCIQYIELNGIHELPKLPVSTSIELPNPPASTSIELTQSNFIGRMSEGWAIFWTGLLITGVGSIGYFMGDYFAKNRIDQEKVDLRNEIKKLQAEKLSLTVKDNAQVLPKDKIHVKAMNKK